VGREIVHADDVAWRERRYQTLFEIGEEYLAVDRRIDDERSGDAVSPQASDESGHLPVTVGHFGNQSFASQAATPQPGHIG
jgi:hypothetical protein